MKKKSFKFNNFNFMYIYHFICIQKIKLLNDIFQYLFHINEDLIILNGILSFNLLFKYLNSIIHFCRKYFCIPMMFLFKKCVVNYSYHFTGLLLLNILIRHNSLNYCDNYIFTIFFTRTIFLIECFLKNYISCYLFIL